MPCRLIRREVLPGLRVSNLTGFPISGLEDKRGFIDKDQLDMSERKAVEFWMKGWGVT